MAACSWRSRLRIMDGARVGRVRIYGKLVIRLQFVTSKGVEAALICRRVDVGEQTVEGAEPGEFVRLDGPEPHISHSIDHLETSHREAARKRAQARSRVRGAERMIPVFGPRH